MVGGKRLDYLAIPDSGGKIKADRKKRAVEEIHKRVVDKVLIMRGKDSEEDILFLGKIVKKGDRVGIDTFPLHFEEYKELIKKAQRDRRFPTGVKVEHIYTRQSIKLLIYGFLGWLEEKFKRRKLALKKNRDEKILEGTKEIVKRALN